MERPCSGEDSGFAVTVGCAVGETKIIRKMLESRFGRRGVILAITVKDVLEIAQTKGCTLAAGGERLNRVVRYVDCIEIPDMEAWMRPNVIYITTGYAYRGTREEIMALICSLNEAKAAALAIKSRFIGQYLEDVLKLADEFQFPIIIMPESLPFIELNYAVMEALVKSQNNLIDRMKSQLAEYNRREMDKRLFIDFLTGNITCEEESDHRVSVQKWPKPPYRVMILETEEMGERIGLLSEEEAKEQLEKIERHIRESLAAEKCTAVVLSNNGSFPCILKSDMGEIQQKCFEGIQRYIAEKSGYDMILGISGQGDSYLTFQDVYRDAVDAVEIAKRQKTGQRVVCIEQAGYWRVLKEISKQSVCKGYVEKKLGGLIKYDQENESNLLETLETFVSHLGARNMTAASLYLHRNTLMYRIKKIEHLTGYDLSDSNSILELSLALHLRRFL